MVREHPAEFGSRFLRVLPWLIAAGAVAQLLWALQAQAALQPELTRAMAGVQAHVAEARVLTGQTADALLPLAATAQQLESMNRRLLSVTGDLAAINRSMASVTTRQEGILARLHSLSDGTRQLGAALDRVDQTNRALLGVNQALAIATEQQAGQLTDLTALTGDAIDQLAHLNGKLSFLRPH